MHCDNCGGDGKGITYSYCAACLEATRMRAKSEAEKGREHDREQFRQGVDAWQKRIRQGRKRIRALIAKLRWDMDYMDKVENDSGYARREWRKEKEKRVDVERRAKDSGDQAAAHLEDLERLRRKAQLYKEAKWDAERRIASAEKRVARMSEALKVCYNRSDQMKNASVVVLDHARYASVRSMITEALKE